MSAMWGFGGMMYSGNHIWYAQASMRSGSYREPNGSGQRGAPKRESHSSNGPVNGEQSPKFPSFLTCSLDHCKMHTWSP